MSDQVVPFYTQTALLDPYIHARNPSEDPDALEIILELLRTRPDLRVYFFENRPSAAWAPILWEQGFFGEPPQPRQSPAIGAYFPRWDVQDYLVSVAAQVPDIVLKHVQTIQGPGWYISRAILALTAIPAEKAAEAVPRIVTWLEDPSVAVAISEDVYKLVKSLTEADKLSEAIDLFRALTAPIPPGEGYARQNPFSRGEAVGKFAHSRNRDELLSVDIKVLGQAAAAQIVTILEGHLRTALEIEAQGEDIQATMARSGWRSAIEDTDQDTADSYKDLLLRGLRDALQMWVSQDSLRASSTVERYLEEPVTILRRLGLHILGCFPQTYPALLSRTLMETTNLDDIAVRHEFFLLMERGFPFLATSQQELLVDAICRGPAEQRLAWLAASVAAEHPIDPVEYIDIQRKLWIRDRLWMIRGHLAPRPASTLRELTTQFGVPTHPTFTSWISEGFFVQDVSPLGLAELSRMPPEELAAFLAQWQPSTERRAQPEVVSYEGLAKAVAEVVVRDPQRYRDHLVKMALPRPEYAFALLDKFRDPGEGQSPPWDTALELCEGLLAQDSVRASETTSGERDWVSVRLWIVHLLEAGISDPQRSIPSTLLGRVRDLLSALIDDPDPDAEGDHPPKGWFGHNDPATVAINRVRPSALLTLIKYASMVALTMSGANGDDTHGEPGPERLEVVVREALTRKLDRSSDPSWALHSVYGHFLPRLYWLDRGWVESHIDDVFPVAADESSTWYFAAAWDSFVTSNDFYPPMLQILHPKYRRGVENLARGYTTETHLHLQPETGLALHLSWEYLLGTYDLRSAAGKQSLIAMFFAQVPSKSRGSVAWALWRICDANPDERCAYWPRVRALWEWRVQMASDGGHSTEYDDEMQRFAHLLSVMPPGAETISTIWPLLEALLPHMTRPEFPNLAWIETEKYLASEVERDPLRVVQFYKLMHEQLSGPVIHYADESQKILETAAASKVARTEALSLIDSIARFGDYRFRHIYERYVR